MKFRTPADLTKRLSAVLVLLALWVPLQVMAVDPADLSNKLIITNARIIDGSGALEFGGAIRIRGKDIVAIGDLVPSDNEQVIDAAGELVTPGFIDTHSHMELIVDDDRHVIPAISQGITTIIVGQDGFSPYPLKDWYAGLESNGVGPNVASYAGHNTLRGLVLKNDAKRTASEEEIPQIKALLAEEMRSGALGFSTGLEYDTGIYAYPDEIIALTAEAGRFGGRYITHIRSEDREFWTALDEAINVGRQTGMPVQISHIKLSMKGLWGQAGTALERLEAARAEGIDVTADIYPYTFWKSTMTVILPERNLEDREALEFAFQEIAPPEQIVITMFVADPSVVGKNIVEIAAERNQDVVTVYLDLLQQSEAYAAEWGLISQDVAAIVATAMSEEDLLTFLRWDHTNVCSDGERGAHPRAYGAYPRVLARYVREMHALPMEQAIRKMTALPARHMGIANRGTLAPGMRADIVIFDPERVQDHATVSEINALSTGISQVWVNGQLAFAEGEVTAALPGEVVRHTDLK